jgi:CubicO group peptidase (beta-lactamase class C family)
VLPTTLLLLTTYALTGATPATSDAARIKRVERGIEPLVVDDAKHPLQLDVDALMKVYRVPGISIAVIDGYRIVWAKAYGVVGADDPTPLDTHTLFQAASISKPVTATAMLRMVEDGKLSLDQDVNTYLKTWHVPENEFTKNEKVTLRRLASHTAGTTVHGFPGYAVGAPVPSIVQILDGTTPANTPAVRVDFTPGSQFRYSGGGTTIEQLVMTDVSGKTFPELMRTSVLDKIGMADSTYEQPLAAQNAAHAAHATYADGKPVRGRWHVYPEMGPAGLWTTPTDLAKFAIETALAAKGKSAKVLSSKATRERLTAQPGTDGGSGLGFFVSSDAPGQFGHEGANEGFQSLLTMNTNTGKGVVIMANSDAGTLFAKDLANSVAREYVWSVVPEPHRPLARRLVLIDELTSVDAALKAYGAAKADPVQAKEIEPALLIQVAFAVQWAGHRKDALTLLERNTSEHPKSAEARVFLGQALASDHESEKARRAFEAALEIDPNNSDAAAGIDELKKRTP